MTKDESAKMDLAIENWSAFDLGFVILMVAFIVAVLYNLFYIISWIQFIDRIIIIVPAIIGLALQSNFCHNRTAVNTDAIIHPIIKQMTLVNAIATDSVVKRAKFIINLAINLIVRKPFIFTLFMRGLVIIDIFYIYSPRTIKAAFLSEMILTASFNQLNIAGRLIRFSLLQFGIYMAIEMIAPTFSGIIIVYRDASIILTLGLFLLIFRFSFFCDLHSHEIVYISVALSITTFTHDLLLLFVNIPGVVSVLLEVLLREAYIYFTCLYTYRFNNDWNILLFNLIFVFIHIYIIHMYVLRV